MLDPGGSAELILVVVLLFLYALFSAAEVALMSVRKGRLRQLVEEGNETAALIEQLAEDANRLLATSDFGRMIVGVVAVASAAVIFTPRVGRWIAGAPLPWLAAMHEGLALLLVIIVMSAVLLVFGRLLPKRLAHRYAESIAFSVAGPYDVFARISWPIVSALVSLVNGLAHLLGDDTSAESPFMIEEEIRTMVDAGEEEGLSPASRRSSRAATG